MLLLEVLNHTQGFSDGHRAIAAWLLEHRNEAPTLTTKQIARATFTSPAAVVRFAQKLGYNGFEELRSELARESVYLNQHFRGVDANQPLSANDSMMTVAAKVSALARETTDDTLSLMDEATLARAVELMEHARAIHLAAVSFPLLYGQDFQLKMRRIGKPVLAVSHYEMPLALALEHGGWHDRATIGRFVRLCQALFDRLGDRVTHWILVNQINMVAQEGFNHLGVPTDETDDPTSARYQALHNEMVACALATAHAHEHHPQLEIGVMEYANLAYPATTAPADVLACYRRNQMEQLPADVLVQGRYPGYCLRFFEERGITVVAEEGDLEALAAHTADFVCFSYYLTQLCSAESVAAGEQGNGDTFQNPLLEANPWGWAIDPTGLRGFFAWGALDIVSASSCEMSKRYGFIHVDQDDYGQGTGRRTPKESFAWMQRVVASNGRELGE